MNTLQSIAGTLPGYILYTLSMLLAGAQLAVLIRLIWEGQGMKYSFPALLHFALGVFFLAVLLDYSYNCLIRERPDSAFALKRAILSLPWPVFAGLELLSAAVIALYMVFLRRYRDTHLSADSIRLTVDLLPAGLMVSDADGTVMLSNLKMTELCRELTGGMLRNARQFRKQIESASADKGGLSGVPVHTPSGETWQFAGSRFLLEGCEYEELTAVDMTEKYRITGELSDKNRQLHRVQDRMKAVAARERGLVTERERMNARVTVHDRMGAVLLSGKYYLDHPENIDETELLRLMEYSSRLLLGEAEQPESGEDPLGEAVRTAERIGVRTELDGKVPEDGAVRSLIAQAVGQCSANTARHAGGDRLRIRITETHAGLTAVFTNNGRAPAGPVAETGGLAILRKAVEEAGGSMTIESSPVFRLTLFLPSGS